MCFDIAICKKANIHLDTHMYTYGLMVQAWKHYQTLHNESLALITNIYKSHFQTSNSNPDFGLTYCLSGEKTGDYLPKQNRKGNVKTAVSVLLRLFIDSNASCKTGNIVLAPVVLIIYSIYKFTEEHRMIPKDKKEERQLQVLSVSLNLETTKSRSQTKAFKRNEVFNAKSLGSLTCKYLALHSSSNQYIHGSWSSYGLRLEPHIEIQH